MARPLPMQQRRNNVIVNKKDTAGGQVCCPPCNISQAAPSPPHRHQPPQNPRGAAPSPRSSCSRTTPLCSHTFSPPFQNCRLGSVSTPSTSHRSWPSSLSACGDSVGANGGGRRVWCAGGACAEPLCERLARLAAISSGCQRRDSARRPHAAAVPRSAAAGQRRAEPERNQSGLCSTHSAHLQREEHHIFALAGGARKRVLQPAALVERGEGGAVA